jgi:hypothetical protein
MVLRIVVQRHDLVIAQQLLLIDCREAKRGVLLVLALRDFLVLDHDRLALPVRLEVLDEVITLLVVPTTADAALEVRAIFKPATDVHTAHTLRVLLLAELPVQNASVRIVELLDLAPGEPSDPRCR